MRDHPWAVTVRLNGAYTGQKFWFPIKGPDVLPRRYRRLNALGETLARRSEIERLDARARPPFQFRSRHHNLGVRENLRICLIVHEAIDVVAVKMGDEDRLDCLGLKTCRRHAREQPAVPAAIDRMIAGPRVDQNQLIAHLQRHHHKTQWRLIVRKTSRAQRGLELFDADIPDKALPQRNVTHAIKEREDFNVANRVFAEGWRGRRLSVGRADKRDRLVDSKRGVGTGCTKYQVATRDLEHRSALPRLNGSSVSPAVGIGQMSALGLAALRRYPLNVCFARDSRH